MANIRLKKGQTDPKNPHATSVKAPTSLKTANINNVDIKSRRAAGYHWDDRYYVANCPTCKEEYSSRTVEGMHEWEDSHNCEAAASDLASNKVAVENDIVADLQGGLYVKGVEFYHAGCLTCGQKYQTKTIREMKTIAEFHECGEVDNSNIIDYSLTEIDIPTVKPLFSTKRD